ncbi:MAG: polysaccharide deacetylase family protein [Oscillospiraceae bacterium]
MVQLVKIGSVKFFKVVILTTALLLIIIPTITSIALGVNCYAVKHKLAAANSSLIETQKLLDKSKSEAVSDPVKGDLANSAIDKTPSFEYQTLYSSLYSSIPYDKVSDDHIAYLTFDDGPSSNTMRILEILAKYNIKATFFVTGPSSESHPEYLKAIADAGHTIGVHSYSHKYTEIYSSVDAYLMDFEKMHSLVKSISGVSPTVFRFPGGSINSYNSDDYMEIIAEMTRRGYAYYDWNVSSGDVALRTTSAEIVENVLSGAKQQNRSIILMHDRLDTDNTVAALPSVIDGLIEQGYTFAPITNAVRPITFSYSK